MEFSGADWIELGLAVLLAGLAWISRPILEPWAARLAVRTRWCMLALAIAPVALRLILLPRHPVPTPNIYDEFAHLLVADTVRHFRLANAVHPMHRFFETFFTLQEPSYSSIYPLGPGLAMALGRAFFGTPWAGVLLGAGAFCSLCYWMLQAWTTPLWALNGGILAVIEFGPLSEWTNTYWGGSVAACAGCVVFGALPRLSGAGLRPALRRNAILLGAGLGLHLLTRPYESIFLLLAVILFFIPERKNLRQIAGVAALAALPAIALMLLQNKQITGSFTTLPYELSQQQYGVPTSLTFQNPPLPERKLTAQQGLEYRSQMSYRERNGETVLSYLLRLEYRVRYYRFFFLPALYLVLPFFFLSLREYRFVWVVLTLLIFALAANFYPFFYPHYIAGLTCLFVLVSVTGLRQLSRLPLPSWAGARTRGSSAEQALPNGPSIVRPSSRPSSRSSSIEAAWMILALCGAHFVLWYGLHLFDPAEMLQYESWDVINHANPERRIALNHDLADLPGQQLVIVHYSPRHIFQEEWVNNEADIDAAPVVWARDLGPEQNEELLDYYSGRTAWLLNADAEPPSLTPYPR
jgi:hypothetical protein